ncbi:MAG: hypothetical protein ACI97A_000518 [Planctomycetota bacterium]|jgi:hypothetical protein
MNHEAESLDRFERWMLQVVSHPEGIEAGITSNEAHQIWPTDSVEEIATAGPQLSAMDRLRVYSDMYYWRLVESLAEDFPVVQFTLGHERFHEIAKSYLHHYPSSSPNLAHLGSHFSAFLAETNETIDHRGFLVDVASVERATNVCFDEKNVTSVPADDILNITPEAWGALRLSLIPAHRRLALQFPVDEFIEARKEDRHLEVPAERDSWLLLYRRDYTVWRTTLSESQFVILETLEQGGTLLDAIEAAANLPEVDFDQLVASIGNWFRIWTGIGLFASIQ